MLVPPREPVARGPPFGTCIFTIRHPMTQPQRRKLWGAKSQIRLLTSHTDCGQVPFDEQTTVCIRLPIRFTINTAYRGNTRYMMLACTHLAGKATVTSP